MTTPLAARQHWQNIGFICGLCERHYPNFQLYSESLGEPQQGQLYRKILNKVWEYLAGQLTSLKNLEKSLPQLEEITPQPGDADSYGVYPALDACLLLTSALQMILDDSIDDSDTAAHLSRATVAQFIAVISGQESFDSDTQQHELYDAELQMQQWLREQMTQPADTATIIKETRRALRQLDCSNLGISLE
ncbi:MAG: YjaG family protein [Gammaproteobacteria bacterium]|nr:YjaG family protein [Gammaproteobacteria bacterium]